MLHPINWSNSLYIIILTFLLLNCKKKSDYHSVVKEELSKGIVLDSVVFNMHFGQTKKEFFDTCWKLNNKGIVSQGPSNNFVQYVLPKREKDSLDPNLIMLFYGIFDADNKMQGMDLKFYSNGWSIGNKELQAKNLMPKIKDSLLKWYPGNNFFPVKIKKDSLVFWAKIDGNRRIIIEPITDPKDVNVIIDDLRVLKN